MSNRSKSERREQVRDAALNALDGLDVENGLGPGDGAWLADNGQPINIRSAVQITPTEETIAMDMRKFASKYVKPDQVRDGPIATRVVNVFEDDRYGRPVLELESGSQFTLNDTNLNALIKAWGAASDDWLGKELTLELGTYKDYHTDPPEEKETVRVRAVSADANGSAPLKPLPPSKTGKMAKPIKDDLDDSSPF
jgi:hypothetical protein